MKILRTILGLALLFWLGVASASAQTQTFSLTTQAVAIPGSETGQQTLAAAVTGIAMTITPNFDLRQDDVITSDGHLQGYFGGFTYRLPVLQRKLNNMSPTLNGYNFQFYLTASAGQDRVGKDTHYAFLAGGGLNYKMGKSGTWTFGCEVRWAKLPGYRNSTALVSVGPTLHF